MDHERLVERVYDMKQQVPSTAVTRGGGGGSGKTQTRAVKPAGGVRSEQQPLRATADSLPLAPQVARAAAFGQAMVGELAEVDALRAENAQLQVTVA